MRGLLGLALLLISTLAVVPTAQADSAIADSYHESFTQEKLEDYTAAIQALMPVYEQHSNKYTINLRLGWLNYLAGHYRKALTYYRSAASAVPSAVDPKLGEAKVGFAQKRYDDVEQTCYSIIKADYYNYFGNRYLVTALLEQNKFTQATAVAQKMLEIYPSDITFLEQLALIHSRQGNTKAARALYNDLWALDPNNLNAFRFLKQHP